MSSSPGSESYTPLLARIADEASRYGESLQLPCEPKALADLQVRARQLLDSDLPPGYADFLALHNGLDWDGLVIYASETLPIAGREDRSIEGFVEANLDSRDNARMKRFLVLGDSGLDMYVYEPGSKEFSAVDRISLDRNAAFTSFQEMLAAALRSRVG